MPSPPVLLGGFMVLLFAFLLGRCTAGNGNEVSTATNTTIAPATTTTTAIAITHVVKENETLAGIADQYGLTLNELAIANSIGNTNNIFVGQVLTIPPPGTTITTTSTTLKKAKKNS